MNFTDYYAPRLADPSILDRCPWVDDGSGELAPLVHCEGARRSGHRVFQTPEARDAALELMSTHSGFPNLRVGGFPWQPGEDLAVQWGEPIEDELTDYAEGDDWNSIVAAERRNGERLGYSPEAIDQYIERLNYLYA